ncbi:MAG: SMC-Scp complex subunit ScpB [Candidatus Cloacimonadota bacterium]|nr:SMC-Scp complex subunit ScpB [Candidatus Cloacimonadota bacterium]
MDIKKVIEVLIFASDKPVSLETLAEELNSIDYTLIRRSIDEINDELEETERPFCIRKVAGGFTYATRKQYFPLIEKMYKDHRQIKLSKTAMEVLAIIAYHQPITRAKIDAIRGVNSTYHIRNLLEVSLVKIKGRLKKFGQPILYGTGDKFLKFFGLNNVEDLPNLHEIKELIEDDLTDPAKFSQKDVVEENDEQKLLI